MLLTPVVRGPPSLSPLAERVRSATGHATCCLPPLPSGGGGNPSPRTYVDGAVGWSVGQPTLLLSQCLTTSPSLGVDGRSGRRAGPATGPHTTCQPTALLCGPLLAKIVRDRARLRISPMPPSTTTSDVVTRGNFVTLYEQCAACGLKARIAIRYAAGQLEVSLTCPLSLTSAAIVAPTVRRYCCRRHRDLVATTAAWWPP